MGTNGLRDDDGDKNNELKLRLADRFCQQKIFLNPYSAIVIFIFFIRRAKHNTLLPPIFCPRRLRTDRYRVSPLVG
jgi:hypothetical protein